ncbi:MAG: M48 family metalloprotease [Gammaproteobacteria bacterium]|nr:M48 family metalloprotease [Gammaproteobacteria bacterium]
MITVKHTQSILLRTLLAMAIALCSLASVAQTDRIPLPDMGNSASGILSQKEERQYAQALLRQMRALDVLVDDPLINDYFQSMGFRLVAQSDKPDKEFHFVVLDESRINAFAAPGGVIALHSGLILAADNEHEVAGVLAHEVAHITQLHLYRALESSQRMTVPIALAMLGLILAGGGSGEAVQGALMGGTAMSQQMQINFTRHNEYEADRIGITTLSLAGYDPEGMAGFFSKLQRLTRPNGEGPPEFLRTHPVSVNRIAEARNRAQNLPRVQPGNGLDFLIMQSRLRAMAESKPVDAIAWFRDQLDQGHTQARDKALKYGLAIALQRHTEYDEARALLQELLAEEPDRLAYQLQMSDLYLDEDRDEYAIEILGSLYHSFPGNHAIAMQYAKALLANEDPQRAETASIILRQQILYRDEDPALFALYARSANIAGDKVRATEAIAESYYQRGGIKEAIEQLERLTQKEDLDYYERSRVSARLMEMRNEIADMRDGERSS